VLGYLTVSCYRTAQIKLDFSNDRDDSATMHMHWLHGEASDGRRFEAARPILWASPPLPMPGCGNDPSQLDRYHHGWASAPVFPVRPETLVTGFKHMECIRLIPRSSCFHVTGAAIGKPGRARGE